MAKQLDNWVLFHRTYRGPMSLHLQLFFGPPTLYIDRFRFRGVLGEVSRIQMNSVQEATIDFTPVVVAGRVSGVTI